MWLLLVFLAIFAIILGVVLSDILFEWAAAHEATSGLAVAYLKIYHPITMPAIIAGIILLIVWWIGSKLSR